MTNTSIHLGDKATWMKKSGPSPETSCERFTPEAAVMYWERGFYIHDLWAIYRDGDKLFTVNTNGTLRSIRTYVENGVGTR